MKWNTTSWTYSRMSAGTMVTSLQIGFAKSIYCRKSPEYVSFWEKPFQEWGNRTQLNRMQINMWGSDFIPPLHNPYRKWYQTILVYKHNLFLKKRKTVFMALGLMLQNLKSTFLNM